MTRSTARSFAAIACTLVFNASAQVPAYPNFSGLWWNSPAGSESGWGVAVDHQQNIAFAAFLTYDSARQPTWYFMSRADRYWPDAFEDIGSNTFLGRFHRAQAPPVEAGQVSNFPRSISATDAGNGGFHFAERGASVFWGPFAAEYKSIVPLVFGERAASCSESLGAEAGPPNFQGLWWNAPAGSEVGWGIYAAHQGDVTFAIWLTYSRDGSPEWFSMELRKAAANLYRGPILRSTGPSHESIAFDPSMVSTVRVGRAALEFSDLDNGTFAVTWEDRDLPMPVKAITRMRFADMRIVCN